MEHLSYPLILLILLFAAMAGGVYLLIFKKQKTSITNLNVNEQTDSNQNSDTPYRLLVEGVKGYAIFMIDAKGFVSTWNEGAHRLKGYAPEEIIGKHFSIFYPKEKIEHGFPGTELGIAAEIGQFEDEGWRLRKDGSKFWANVLITALKDSNGRLMGFSKVTRDLTERKKTESVVLKQAERMRSVVDNVADAIITLNRYFQIESWNPAAERIFGYNAEEVFGQDFTILFHNLKNMDAGIANIFKAGNQIQGRKKDNELFSVDVGISEFQIDSQKFYTAIIRDSTERNQVAATLKAAKETAESANQAKSAFLANMSHEIRTPLGAVIGFSELIANIDLSEAEKSRYMSAIKRNGELLSNLINDILDLSKVEAGKLETVLQEMALSEIVKDVKMTLDLKAKEKGLELQFHTVDNVPPVVKTDQLRLRQILINIIGNAIKFSSEGSIIVTIKMIQTQLGNKLAFVVKDSGKGISADQINKLFTPFSQIDDSHKRKFGGTGLGLILSKRLAHLLNGDVILVESSPGAGSTFMITIDPNGEATPLKLPEPTNFTNTHDELRGVKVLLVEDNYDNQLLVSHLLRKSGVLVEIASNGKEAVDKSKTDNYDVMLMDLQMPVMDGYEATATLRRGGYTKPIVALTAHALSEERYRCLTNGFDEHLSKPVNKELLIQTVKKFSSSQAF